MITLTAEQAAAIGRVLETADGYCTSCAKDLADEMSRICPDHDWRRLVTGRWSDTDNPAHT